MTSALVLFSGGLDSTVCLALASRECERVTAVSFDYGQRHRVELERARAIVHPYLDHGMEHLTVELNARAWGGSALTEPSIAVPATGAVSAQTSIPVTYVPARNLIFLSIAAGIAEARDADTIYIGVNALDYSGYPDCRPDFIDAFRSVLTVAQKRGVEGRPVAVETPLIDMTKAQIVTLGRRLKARLDLTWSCYVGDASAPCGQCEACVLRARGFAEAGVADPALQPKLACPCCRHLTLTQRSYFEVCPVCGWEDDGQDDADADVVRGGPNEELSLTQARRNYADHGACDRRVVGWVRRPLDSERPHPAAAG